MESRCGPSARGTSTDSCVGPAASAAQHPTHFGDGGGDGNDHDTLQHVHHLLRHEGVDREPALRERRKEKGREQHAEWMVSPNECNGDSQKPGATRESVLVVVLV